MLSLPATVRMFLCAQPIDMRKSFDGLTGLVEFALALDPLSGHLFLFLNKRRDRLKILFWERDGLVIWYKKHESHYPHFVIFTEIGECPNNLARQPASAG